MSDSADVTVIIPAYRAAATIRRALASIAAQTLKPRAVVVVDDGSPDETFATANACRDLLRGIDFKLLKQANAGAGAARNRALNEVYTKYVAFLDADDEWMNDKLARSMTYLRDDNYVLIAHDSIEVTGEASERIECAKLFQASAAPFVGLYCRGFLDTTTVVARLDAIREAGGFDTTLPNAQDFELWLAILADPGAKFYVFPDVLSRYHRMPDSIMTHVDRRLRCCMEIAIRYAPALAAHPGSPLASLWFRILAIHREAIEAHLRLGRRGGAFRTIAVLPQNFFVATFRYLFFKGSPRRSTHIQIRDGECPVLRSAYQIMAWIWILAITSAWFAQFANILPAIGRVFRLAVS